MTIAADPASFARGVVENFRPGQATRELRARRRAGVAGKFWDAVVAAIEPHVERLAARFAGFETDA